MSPPPLLRKIDSLRARARRLTLLYGVGRLGVVALSVGGAAASIDYVLRLHEPWHRAALSLVVLAAVLVTFYRDLLRPLCTPLGSVDLAIAVGERFGQLRGVLPSAVEFLARPTVEASSLGGAAVLSPPTEALQRRVIAEAESASEDVSFGEALDPRAAWTWCGLFLAGLLLLVVLLVSRPVLTWTAITRLTCPMCPAAWPQRTHLALLAPVDRVVLGGEIEWAAYDENGRPLPEDARIELRVNDADGRTTIETIPLAPRPLLERTILERVDGRSTKSAERDEASDEVLSEPYASFDFDALDKTERWTLRASGLRFARSPELFHDAAYRLIGGDDRSHPWRRVEVLAPPRLVAFEAEWTPPTYARLAPEAVDGDIRALAGSWAILRFQLDRPIVQGESIRDGAAPTPCEIDEQDPSRLTARLLLDRDQRLQLRVEDARGLMTTLPRQWSVTVVRDEPPRVVWRSPSASLTTTPDAVAPLALDVGDDLGIAWVDLKYVVERGDARQEGLTRLWRSNPSDASADRTLATMHPQELSIEHAWDLSPLALQPGDRVTASVEAVDFARQVGRSAPRALAIVSSQRMATILNERRSQLTQGLGQALRMQQSVLARSDALDGRWTAEAATLASDPEMTRSLAYAQRQVAELLVDPDRGALAAIESILRDVALTRVDDAWVARLSDASASLRHLDKGELIAAPRDLEAAGKGAILWRDARETSADSSTIAALRADAIATLGNSRDAQREVVRTIETLLRELADADRRRRQAASITSIATRQRALQERTAALARRTLGRDRNDLSPSELRELDALGAEQTRLSNDARTVAWDPTFERPQAIDRIAGRMQSASQAIDENRLGAAVALQREIANALASLGDEAPPDVDMQEGEHPNADEGPLGAWLAKAEHLVERQTALLRETTSADQAIAEQGLTRAARARVARLAVEQRDTALAVKAFEDETADAPIVRFRVGEARRAMEAAAGRLARGETNADAQGLQAAAVRVLEQVVDALRKASNGSPNNESPPEDERSPGEQGDDEPTVAEGPQLMLLQAMQEALLSDTSNLNDALGEGRIDHEVFTPRCEALADQQGTLAKLLRDVIGPNAADAASRSEAEDPLADALWKMDAARNLLAEGDAGARPQQLQGETLEHLAARLALIEESATTSSMSGAKAQRSPASSDSEAANSNSTSGSDVDGAAGASGGDASQPGDGETTAANELVQRVWGELPEATRDRMLRAPVEEFLPGYRDRIEAYFRVLAAPEGGSP